MNQIYLIKDEKKDYCLFKIGFTRDLIGRVNSYAGYIPTFQLVSAVSTMAKSKMKIEKAFHQEVEKLGYKFINARINFRKTEWFAVSYNDPFYNELNSKGLKAFATGKNRKEMLGWY